MDSKEFRSTGGKISVKLVGPDAEERQGSGILREYDWPAIVGVLRELIRYLRDSPSLRDLKPARDRHSFTRAGAARTFVGQCLSTAWHCFTIDPRRDDGVGVDDEMVSDTLRLCLQEHKFLQGAAMGLWAACRMVDSKLRDTAVPLLDEGEIVQLESAVDAVAKMTVDEQPTADRPIGCDQPAANSIAAASPPEDDSAYEGSDGPLLTHVDLANRFGLDREPTRKKLDRWRAKNGDGWTESTEHGPREPKYLYRLSAVRHLFEDSTAETSA